jgi:hypothetical protein
LGGSDHSRIQAARGPALLTTLEVEMPNYVHDENIAHFNKLIAESRLDPSRDEDRHKMLLTLLAEEEAKDKKPTAD